VLFTILGKMAKKPEVQFDRLFPKMYNPEIWLKAYEQIAPKPGNMTVGVDGQTIDGAGMALIEGIIDDLRSARYKPSPVRRIYITKPNGELRPLGIPSFRDKLVQTVVKTFLEAIYEPTFANTSHGFRPQRSCHTALEQTKRMTGIRWWVEGDIVGFFDNIDHTILLSILGKRITDQRFLHLIEQFLRAGYVEAQQYHKTYSGTPQGGNLSPILSNIYLNELDQKMKQKIEGFRRGKKRAGNREYWRICKRRKREKAEARKTGDWAEYKRQTQRMLSTPSTESQDTGFRRMYYCRYADDFLIGIIGSKEDAKETKLWLTEYLRSELGLELSSEKTLITHAKNKVRFLGYEVVRGEGKRRVRVRRPNGTVGTQRTCTRKLQLRIPAQKVDAFAKVYGERQGWQGKSRNRLIQLSELEIVTIYNAEIRGFLGYYIKADNYHKVANSILWLTSTSFFKTLAAKRKSTLRSVTRSLKRGPNKYSVSYKKADGTWQARRLVSSVSQIEANTPSAAIDKKPDTKWLQYGHTELGQRIQANQCEWCGTKEGQMEVHHVRKLKDLQGKQEWERQMIRRRRKTMVLCRSCHHKLHAGRLTEANRTRVN
jgi:group II intron reverse transcriptase/maturase